MERVPYIHKRGKFVSDREIADILYRPDQKMCSYGAWHWLLSQAAYQDHIFNYKGRLITIKRGDIPITYRDLAGIFNWAVNTVRAYIRNLEVAGYLETSVDTGFLIITICNYNKIQKFSNSIDTANNTKINTTQDTSTETKSDTNRTKETKITKEGDDGSALRAGSPASPSSAQPRWHLLLKKELGEAIYKSWIKSLKLEDGFVICPTRFIHNWCKEHYAEPIRNAVEQTGVKFIDFKVDSKAGIA